MTIDHDNQDPQDPRDARLAELARALRVPPAAPREAMWEAIAAARRERREAPRVLPLRRWGLGIGIAAALVLGIALGRLSIGNQGGNPPPDVVVTPGGAPSDQDLTYRVAATQYLSRAEILLTTFRASGNAVPDSQFHAAARDLLTLTRLMQDAPSTQQDPGFQVLLADLELVLVQIAQAEAGTPSPDAELITQALQERGLIARLRTAIPAGQTTQAAGEL